MSRKRAVIVLSVPRTSLRTMPTEVAVMASSRAGVALVGVTCGQAGLENCPHWAFASEMSPGTKGSNAHAGTRASGEILDFAVVTAFSRIALITGLRATLSK